MQRVLFALVDVGRVVSESRGLEGKCRRILALRILLTGTSIEVPMNRELARLKQYWL